MNGYALYKGDQLLAIGTVKEIADKMGLKENTVWHYQTPTYRKRAKNGRLLVKLTDEE